MIKNYFKTAFRSLLRNKSYAAINIAGLAVGIAVCLVIFVIIQFERGYDGFHENKDRIYRYSVNFIPRKAANTILGCLSPYHMP